MAEQKRIDDERRKAAQAEWADQQKRWAKDRAAREAAFHQHEQELATTREQRREQREKELRAKWNAAFLADADTQDELTLHAQRVADLERMKDVASLSADAKIGVRVDLATRRRMIATRSGWPRSRLRSRPREVHREVARDRRARVRGWLQEEAAGQPAPAPARLRDGERQRDGQRQRHRPPVATGSAAGSAVDVPTEQDFEDKAAADITDKNVDAKLKSLETDLATQ